MGMGQPAHLARRFSWQPAAMTSRITGTPDASCIDWGQNRILEPGQLSGCVARTVAGG